ncbi:MAG TPA: hypothetical protein VI542_04715 [Candidatus Tectomicrobia bacterium]
MNHLDEGCSVRATARLVQVCQETVARPGAGLRPSCRALSRSARACSAAHGIGVRRTVERCEKKPKRCADHELGAAGDWWDHTAVAAASKLVVSLMVGKRTSEQTRAVVQDAHDRLRSGYLPAMFTDAFASDESALVEVCGRRYPAKGQGRRPVMRWRQGLAYGQGKKSSKGSRMDGVEGRAVHGKARLKHVLYLLGSKQINTSVGERPNGTSRLRTQRKVRKTLAFSKARRYHRWRSWLSVGLDNFCRPHSSLKINQADQVTHRSPAMAAGVTDHLWSTREWLLQPVLGGRDNRRTLPTLHSYRPSIRIVMEGFP